MMSRALNDSAGPGQTGVMYIMKKEKLDTTNFQCFFHDITS